MALDLQLSTQKAREELRQFLASLSAFEQKLASAGNSGKGLETRLNQLAQFRGIEANAVNSLNRLAEGMVRLSNSATQINNVSRNLNSLARVRVDAVAANVDKISKALAGLRMPPNLERFATTLQRIGTAATQAAGGMRQFAAASNSFRVPAGLNTMPGALSRIGASARSGASGMSFLGSAARVATGVLAGFGVTLGAFGFSRFIENTYEAVRAVDRFNNIITATQGANQVGKEMAYIRQIAKDMKLPIDGLVESYGKFSAAAVSTGESVENIHKTFTAMSTAARVLKLDNESLKLAFRGLEQMYSKGAVSMEELRRQWGEQIPGGFAIAAKAMGMTQAALTDLVASGQLAASDFIPKLADELQKTFGPGLQTALSSAQAAMDNFGNAVFLVSEAFGRGFFDAFKGSLDSLATAMQDPAFIEGAKTFGNVLGQVLNAVVQLLKLVADNWDAVKVGIQIVLSLGVASVVNGWVQSLYNAGRVASLVAYNAGAMGVAFARLGFVQNLLVGLTAAMWSLVRPAVAFVAAMGPLGWTILAAAVAIGAIVAIIQDWEGTVNRVTDANNKLSQATYDMTHWFENFITVPPLVRQALDLIYDGSSNILKVFYPLLRAVEFVQMGFEYFYPPAEKAADAMDKTADAAKQSASPMKQVGDAAKVIGDESRKGAPAVDILGKQIAGTGDEAADAAVKMREFAAAAAAAARSNVGGNTDLPLNAGPYDGKMNKYGEYEGYSGGGISGQSSGRRTFSLPASAFVNAPSFAGGGISDGIPAVLHPNEAVVPLAGGGTIPVQMMSGGQSSLMLLKPLQQLVDYSKQTKTEVSRVWEATTVQTVLMKNAFGRIEQILSHIDNQRLVELTNAVRAIQISGGGSGGGGGFGSFPGGSGYNASSNIDKLLAQMSAEIAQVQYLAATVNNTGSGALTMVAGKIVADGSKAYFEAILPGLQAERDMIEARYRAGLLTEGEVNAMLRNLEKRMPDGGGFASGSPNASKDANGGFKATLHKDEAVIPLPDGRTVPVTIRSDAMDRITRFLDSGTERLVGSTSGGRQGNNVTIQVNMNVQVKDAESFRASQDQIMRDLKTNLDRAARTIGNRSDIDDPTRRM